MADKKTARSKVYDDLVAYETDKPRRKRDPLFKRDLREDNHG